MKKSLISLAIAGLLSAVQASDNGTYAVLDSYNGPHNTLNLSVYSAMGAKIDEREYSPAIYFASMQDANRATEVINKYCKGTRIDFLSSSDFTCDGKYSFIDLLAEHNIEAYYNVVIYRRR